MSCVALFLASGCGGQSATHLDLAADTTWTTLNDRAGRYPTEIRLRGQRGVEVTGARFAPDTTRWREEASGDGLAVPTEEVAWISFRSRRAGAIQGSAGGVWAGLAVDAVTVALLAGGWGDRDAEFRGELVSTLLVIPVASTALGAGLGTLPGSGAPAPDYVKERQGD